MIAKMQTTFSRRKIAGIVLAELMMASAVFAMTSVALLVGLITIQRTFRASLHHSKSQIEQARLDKLERLSLALNVANVLLLDGGFVERVEVVDCPNRVAEVQQAFADMGADEPRTACDQEIHAGR